MASRYLLFLLFVILAPTFNLIVTDQLPEIQSTEKIQTPEILNSDLVFVAENFLESNTEGLVIMADGLAINSELMIGTYSSQPIKAPHQFNALLPQWLIDQPDNTEFHIELRTGTDPLRMSEWVDIHTSTDWTLPEDEDVVGHMLFVPAKDKTHDFVQFRIRLSRVDTLSNPLLRELTLTFIDSTSGPSVEEMIRQQEEINRNEVQAHDIASEEADSYPKPLVISREVWCIHPDCDYDTEGLTYQPVTHLILHHTVSPNDQDIDSADAVRGIWYGHISRGWGDIGYNYLVDSKGVIFEGHLGGDDVVGIHARDANTGSMGLAMIGTFTQVNPPDPMTESIVDLFSWKADQKNIDVFDASDTLPNVGYGLPHLMGHRDVGINTQCPGDAAHILIPYLRDEIASRIGLESPHIYVDELSSSFQKNNANWLVPKYQCGHNAHSWYTWSTTTPEASAFWGEWRPEIPESGKYRIESYAPYCLTGASETEGAYYSVTHAEGTSSVVINQDDRVGLWTSLGEYTLQAGKDTVVRLSDLTTTDNGRGVWFDAIRLLPIELLPIARTELPADGSWLKDRTINFTWLIENPEKVKTTVLQVATDAEFQNRVANEIWPVPTLSATIEFDQDYRELYWRVVVTSESGNEYPSETSRFGIDTQPPTSNVTELYWLEQTGLYQVFWHGEDALVGIAKYNIDYRLAGDDTWERWLSDTPRTSAYFTPPDPSGIYEFRSQAVDELGHTEAVHSTADISSEEARVFSHAVLLPMVSSN